MFDGLRTFAGKIGLATTRCPVCGILVDGPATLCASCALDFEPRTTGYCPSCGTVYGDEHAPPTVCGECRHSPPPWDMLHFHGVYSDALRRLIISYKFNGVFGRTQLLADLAMKAFKRDDHLPDIIIPVPLHTKRLLRRGFNQSTELSKIIAKSFKKPLLNRGLVRIRHTRPQTRLDHKERQMNIKDAFVADSNEVEGKMVLLVDDVYTTGATLAECTRTLKRAGAAGVDVLVLARTQQD